MRRIIQILIILFSISFFSCVHTSNPPETIQKPEQTDAQSNLNVDDLLGVYKDELDIHPDATVYKTYKPVRREGDVFYFIFDFDFKFNSSGGYIEAQKGTEVGLYKDGGLASITVTNRCYLTSGIKLQAGTKLKRYSNGILESFTPSEDIKMGVFTIKAGNEVTYYPSKKVKTLTIKNDAKFGNLIIKGGTEIELYENVSIKRLIVGNDLAYGNYTYPAGSILFFSKDGKVLRVELKNDFELSESLVAKGGSSICFYPNGTLAFVVPTTDTTMGKLVAKADSEVYLFSDKLVQKITTAKDLRLSDNIVIDANTEMAFYETGQIHYFSTKNDIVMKNDDKIVIEKNKRIYASEIDSNFTRFTLRDNVRETLYGFLLQANAEIILYNNMKYARLTLSEDFSLPNGWIIKSGAPVYFYENGSYLEFTVAKELQYKGQTILQGSKVYFREDGTLVKAIPPEDSTAEYVNIDDARSLKYFMQISA